MFTFGKTKKQDRNKQTKISFALPDKNASEAALKQISKVGLPSVAQMQTLQSAYSVGDALIERLTKKISIDKQNGKIQPDSYRETGRIYEELLEQRNIVADVIEKMVQPTINVVGDISIRESEQWDMLYAMDKRLFKLEQTMKMVYGKTPSVSAFTDGKIPWYSSMKKAAEEIISLYQNDSRNSSQMYRSLRDASDEYFDSHTFVYKPDLTKDMLYENVKKSNNY
jgi:hypothetical protein